MSLGAKRERAMQRPDGQVRGRVQYQVGAFDVWVYRKDADAIRYLLLRTSQDKADRWFNGGRFRQIPSDCVGEGETLVQAAWRCLAEFGLAADSLWAVEHSYTIYNRRYENVQLILVLAAEVKTAATVQLTWEHSEHAWLTAAECQGRLEFRGLIEGLRWTQHYGTEAPKLMPELRLA